MNLTNLGRKTLDEPEKEKRAIAEKLISGDENMAQYVNGVCYDQVAYMMNLLGFISNSQIIRLSGADFLPLMGFSDSDLPHLTQWDGSSPIASGSVIAFYRERDGVIFHVALSIGGTNIRGVNSLSLGLAWPMVINMTDVLRVNSDGSFTYDCTTIRVYISNLTSSLKNLLDINLSIRKKALPPNYKTNEDRGVQSLLYDLCSKKLLTIDFIDILGEGFLASDGTVVGFKNSYNLNIYDAVVTSNPDKGRDIPNIIPIDSQDESFYIIPSRSVKIITVIRPLSTLSPPRLTENSCKEIIRMISPNGNILLYGYPKENIVRLFFESLLSKIDFKRTDDYGLAKEFSIITQEPVVVYTNSNNPNPYIHDEL